jgi:Mrp family chromosome partitioning ATPase
LTQYTPNSVKVQIAQKQRMAAEAEMRHFVAENPGVLTLKPADLNGPGLGVAPAVDLNASLQTATARMHALMAKYNQLTNQLTVVRAQASDLDNGEDKIMQAQTDRDAAEAKYKNFQFSAEQASINEAVGNKVSNINVIELPTPGGRDKHKMLKMAEGILGFFLALAFGLPFLIELVLDQTLKSPLDVQARIASPFFITMPRTNGHGKLGALKRAKNVPLLPANGSQTPGPGVEGQTLSAPANGAVAPWDERHELRPFFETLRDRLMTYFEMINLTHKPKLVAVTSCNAGAGVTTTAAGLASSLSETGEGNVLLVSMNSGDGEAHHFYKGKLTCRIEDALEREKRNPGQVHGNLYVAKEMEADDKLPRVLPKRFSHLVPMMKASDFDYIIFDMPPVSEISITPRLARFMDMVLLVIESEKTSRDAAVRATSLLAESKTNVGLVLNKNRSYVPKRLEQSL